MDKELCLNKRVKNYWRKSDSPLSLKIWARASVDPDVRSWLKLKTTRPVRAVKAKIVKKSKTEKAMDKAKSKM